MSRARSIRLGMPLFVAFMAGCGPENSQESAPPAAATPSVTATAPSAAPAPAFAYPATEKRPTFVTYTGTKGAVKVEDDYAWLENASDPAVQAWVAAQASFARAALDKEPARDALSKRFHDLLATSSLRFVDLHEAGGTLFAEEIQPPKQQAFLVVLTTPNAPAPDHTRVLVDPNVIDPSGGTTIDWYVPSHDGKIVAVSLSKGGSESGDLHFYDVATGKERKDVLPHVNGGTAGGSAAFRSDGKAVYYTKYIAPEQAGGREHQQLYLHVLGTDPKTDVYLTGKDLPDIAEIEVHTRAGSKAVVVRVGIGDGGDTAQWLSTDGKTFARFADVGDKVFQLLLGGDGNLYILSRKDADFGKVLRTPIAGAKLADATPVFTDEGGAQASIDDLLVGATKLYAVQTVGGPSRLVVADLALAGKGPSKATEIPLPPIARATEVTLAGKDDLLVDVQSYTSPLVWQTWRAKEQRFTDTALKMTSPADFHDTQVSRRICHSSDGTEVPMTVLDLQTGKASGDRPTLLTGYGGFDISIRPTFRAEYRPWLEAGGVIAIANLRGGGELGEAWHRGGMLTQKQHVFDDMYACAQELVGEHVTNANELAIEGGSNGGLLMGAELTQHPEAFRAVVAHVGIHDMLKNELTSNGVFNVTEYGSVKVPEQFDALFAYSPFHHVVDGTRYPATLFMTGANDPRVDPYHSRKMSARLQAANASDHPILLRISTDTGHGMGTPLDAKIKELVDSTSFLFGELGMQTK